MKITGEKTIFKNDKGSYHIVIQTNVLQEDETLKQMFMNLHVKFKKGIEVKNKTKVNIKNGFLSFFVVQEDTKVRKIPQLIILDFDILEEGIDTPMKSFETKQKEKVKKTTYDNTTFSSNDVLPF